jgi:hypothetical protein
MIDESLQNDAIVIFHPLFEKYEKKFRTSKRKIKQVDSNFAVEHFDCAKAAWEDHKNLSI